MAGSLAAIHYFQLGLTLAHYDARAHLVVARRILDSLTPGWQQIGAVWLPLPHVLNMLPVQVDAWYRTGASGVAISVLSMALAAGSLAHLLLRTTGSIVAAFTGATLLLVNPERALPAEHANDGAAALWSDTVLDRRYCRVDGQA